jgi:hypothetical protein
MQILAFLAVTALGLFVTWLVHLWVDFVGDISVAIAIWIPACLLYAFLHDRINERRNRQLPKPE